MKTSLYLIVSFLLVSACSSVGPDTLSIKNESGISQQIQSLELPCSHDFEGVEDLRDVRNIRGYWYNGTELDDIFSYMDQAIYGWMPEHPEDEIVSNPVNLSVSLINLHNSIKSSATYYNMVLKVRTQDMNPEYLRTQWSSTIWVGSENEFRNEVKELVDESLAQLYLKLESYCGKIEPG